MGGGRQGEKRLKGGDRAVGAGRRCRGSARKLGVGSSCPRTFLVVAAVDSG